MPEGLLPLFPLELVLLPHALLPLHIFEERYKEMIGECVAQGSEFGVVQARGNGIVRTGCTATVEEVAKRYEDGSMDILALGHRRFEIGEIETSQDYLRASVEYFHDDPAPPPSLELRRKALAAHMELKQVIEADDEPPDFDDPELSFHLGRISSDLDFKQTLLGLRTESERLLQVTRHFRVLVIKKKTEQSMQRVAKQNGHGRHVGGPSDRS